MKTRNRLALMCAALAAGACPGTPSSAQGLAAQSAKIAEFERAGKYAEAIPLAQTMLANQEKGPPNRDLAGALNNLAQLYGDVGRDADAEPLHKRALAIMEKSVGLDSAAMAPELTNLGALYERQLRYAEAEPLFKRALSVRERALGQSHPDVGQSLNNLATLYEREDRHAESEPLFKRALAIYEKAAGPENPAVATVLNNLGQVLKSEGRDADAEPSLALSTRKPAAPNSMTGSSPQAKSRS